MHQIPSNDLPLRPGPGTPPGAPAKSAASTDTAPKPPAAVPVVAEPVIDDPAVALELLPVPQQQAIDTLLTGGSVSDAAQRSGVNRSTIYRWLSSDPLFKSIYERWQDHLRQASRARLTMLSERAVDVLHDALDDRDRNVAFGLLKQMGVLSKKE
jgi:Homeodomain-like domain